jgi:hypothetical protein
MIDELRKAIAVLVFMVDGWLIVEYTAAVAILLVSWHSSLRSHSRRLVRFLFLLLPRGLALLQNTNAALVVVLDCWLIVELSEIQFFSSRVWCWCWCCSFFCCLVWFGLVWFGLVWFGFWFDVCVCYSDLLLLFAGSVLS